MDQFAGLVEYSSAATTQTEFDLVLKGAPPSIGRLRFMI